MSSLPITNNHPFYHAHEQDTLLSEVKHVICLLMPKALMIAGMGQDGSVLVIKQKNAPVGSSEWSDAFFEQELLNEPLVAMPTQLKAIFIASENVLPVPDELYDAAALQGWLSALYHFPPDDHIHTYKDTVDQLQYAFTVPHSLQALMERYFPAARILPAAAGQFNKAGIKDPNIQCLITADRVTATLRTNGKLLWHQVFAYTEPTDIAWQFTHLCKQHQIHVIDLTVTAGLSSPSLFDILPELETFFPKITWSSHQLQQEGHWAPVIYLLQQLYTCAL